MGKKYPYAISNWENNWEDVSSFFQFSNDIRRIMYTTNIIEGLNRQYRKVTKTKSRNGEALLSPSFLLSVYSFGIYIIARNFRSYSRGRVWAEPTKGNDHDALFVMQKIENDVYNFPAWQYCKYKDIFDSRIIINSTAKFYISISYQKDLLSIDTRIFTPSIPHPTESYCSEVSWT